VSLKYQLKSTKGLPILLEAAFRSFGEFKFIEKQAEDPFSLGEVSLTRKVNGSYDVVVTG
jgi:hypothetical protein